MKTIIAGNWKMHMTNKDTSFFMIELKKIVQYSENTEIILCPPFTALQTISKEAKGTKIKIGAQNMHYEKEGAFTGEVSASMLTELGCEYVIIGHSERRQYFNETDETVNKKIKAALKNNLKPIVCVGETLEQRKAGKTKTIITTQLKKGLEDLSRSQISKLIIAYEPIWAIGTGMTARPEQAEEVHSLVRKLVDCDIPLLYGGSVKPDNCKELFSQPNINGGLIGGASLDPKKFNEIIKNAR
ncbi:MAG: triose-phosphate isomerase [Nanoarchaeota archaeon]|nr:triose-phosphate isomerase [Nanoarchaeota archaeon]MBU1704096.1 triose-phosphate isomerase [Nanoarchaeota archaeon]